jgi:hypothetical protein
MYSSITVSEHSDCSKILRVHLCAEWQTSDILCTTKHTVTILSQQNGRDIPAERYADIIKPTAKLLTFIWEMWRFPWHLASFITAREMPGRRFPQAQACKAARPGHLVHICEGEVPEFWICNITRFTRNTIKVVPTHSIAAGKTVGITN